MNVNAAVTRSDQRRIQISGGYIEVVATENMVLLQKWIYDGDRIKYHQGLSLHKEDIVAFVQHLLELGR